MESQMLPINLPLSTIKETDRSIEEANTFSPKKPEVRDELMDQINILAMKMDLHKNGILYLKESVTSIIR